MLIGNKQSLCLYLLCPEDREGGDMELKTKDIDTWNWFLTFVLIFTCLGLYRLFELWIRG